MRDFIQIINEAQGPTFRLMPGLDPDKYVMTDSLRSIDKWQAYTYVGDSSPEGKPNLMGKVGYIMISLRDDTIIPISRGDEHHRGMDLLFDLSEGVRYNAKGKRIKVPPLNFNPGDYYPIWAHGNNYTYPNDIDQMLIAVKKFLSYGGFNGPIKSMGGQGQMMHLSDFVKRGGLDGAEPGGLAPIGQKIVDGFTNLATSIRSIPDSSRVSTTPVFNQTIALLKLLTSVSYEIDFPHSELQKIPPRVKQLQKENDIQGLEDLIFGFHGVKNQIHIALKKMLTSKDDVWNRPRLVGLWGDPDLAVDLLGRI